MSARNMAKRTAAGTLALAVCLSGGAIALAGAANADANFKFDTRIQGDDRYGTAIAASKAAFPDGTKTDNVVLVNGFATVDGLTASYLAGVANAPILYVSDKGADDSTKAEIKRLGAKNVWLVGGTTVIPASVETAIKGDGYSVTRINGSDRYETAKLVAEAGTKIAGKKPAKVFVASGDSFADALAVSPIAYAKGYAIALTQKDSTSQFTKDELGAIGTDAKYLVGGEAVVSKKVQADLSISDAQRIAGADRAVTANLVSDWAKKSEGFNPANAALVGGTNGNGADSLVAASLGAKSFTTLHFAGWDATTVYLKDHAKELTGKGFVFGGKAAVPGDQVDKAQAAAQSVVSNQTLSVGPAETVALTATASAESPNVKTDDRTYTVSGLKADAEYRITLVKASNVTTVGGQTTFAIDRTPVTVTSTNPDGANGQQASGSYLALAGTVASRFLSVNGAPAQNNTGVGTTLSSSGVTNSAVSTPVSGSITFTIDGDTPEAFVPVVYLNGGSGSALADGGASPRLELNSAGMPVETFGVGGQTVYTLVEAALGTIAAGTAVTTVDVSNDIFSSSSAAYFYDANDNFQFGGQPLTMAEFEKAIGAGAQVSGSYAPTASGVSIFNITQSASVTAVGAPTATIANLDSGATANDVKVTYTRPSANAAGVTYKLQRATVAAGTDTVFGTSDDVVGAFSDVNGATDAVNSDGTYTFVSSNTADGYFRYRVQATPPNSSTATDGTQSAANTVLPVAADTARPTSTYADLTTSAGLGGTLDAGDVIKVVFSEAMRAPASGAVVRVNDADTVASVGDLINGTNATFTLNTAAETVGGSSRAAGTVLTITLTGSPTVVSAGTVNGIQLPSTIIDASSLVDVAGNTWNVGTSTDVAVG